jgi:phosphoribosylglycinamide formyltransferase-1
MAYRIGWFSTGRDKEARDLFKSVRAAIKDGTIDAEIAYVFCNRCKGEREESDRFIELVKKSAVNLICFSSRSFEPELRKSALKESPDVGTRSEKLLRWRNGYDAEVLRLIEPFGAQVGVLAGYMLITGNLCDKLSLINLHPALPGGPKGTWQEVMWQLIEQRAERTGAMIHVVTPALDEGPPLTYAEVELRGAEFDPLRDSMDGKPKQETVDAIMSKEGENEPLFAQIRRREFELEIPLLVMTLKELAAGRLTIKGTDIRFNGKKLTRGLCLTDQVREYIRRKRIAS